MDNSYKLDWFQLMTYHRRRVVIYGYGPWYYHVMDWLGMNIFHGRLVDSPVFDDVVSALEWLKTKVDDGTYHKGTVMTGHHAGEHSCSKGCDDREINGYGVVSIACVTSAIKKAKREFKKDTCQRCGYEDCGYKPKNGANSCMEWEPQRNRS